MTQRLYRVRVERSHEVVVIASSEDEAERVAYRAVEDDDGGLGTEELITDAVPLLGDGHLPRGWDRQCLPYGKDEAGERTIDAILSAVQP